MVKTKVVLLSLILSVGCSSSEIEVVEKGIIPKEKMINIIADIQLLEGAHKSLKVNTSRRQRMKDTSFQIIYNKYAIDSVLLDSSLRVYTRYPTLMSEMTAEAASRINTQK